MLAIWTKRGGPGRQAGRLDDEDAVGGLGIAAAGQAADDAAADDAAPGDDADEGAIRTLAATDLVEHRLTLIVSHRKTFLVSGFDARSGRSVGPPAPRPSILDARERRVKADRATRPAC